MHFLTPFFCGAFLCNCIPHLAAGLQGMKFQTPFAKPRGVGESSPFVNFLWGATNLLISFVLLASHPLTVGANPDFLLSLFGALLLGCYLSRHFGKVRQDK